MNTPRWVSTKNYDGKGVVSTPTIGCGSYSTQINIGVSTITRPAAIKDWRIDRSGSDYGRRSKQAGEDPRTHATPTPSFQPRHSYSPIVSPFIQRQTYVGMHAVFSTPSQATPCATTSQKGRPRDVSRPRTRLGRLCRGCPSDASRSRRSRCKHVLGQLATRSAAAKSGIIPESMTPGVRFVGRPMLIPSIIYFDCGAPEAVAVRRKFHQGLAAAFGPATTAALGSTVPTASMRVVIYASLPSVLLRKPSRCKC